jgi:hypothetical protein
MQWSMPALTEIDKRTLRRLRLEARRRAQTAQGQDRVKAVFAYVDLLGIGAIGKILPLIEHEEAGVFWPVFDKVWQYWWSTNHWNARLFAAMKRVGPHPSVMQLPERLIVYRGAHRHYLRTGLSWTTNPRVALRFAARNGGRPCVAMARIKREQAFWFARHGRLLDGELVEEIIVRPKRFYIHEDLDWFEEVLDYARWKREGPCDDLKKIEIKRLPRTRRARRF